jgi:hypothetical protein
VSASHVTGNPDLPQIVLCPAANGAQWLKERPAEWRQCRVDLRRHDLIEGALDETIAFERTQHLSQHLLRDPPIMRFSSPYLRALWLSWQVRYIEESLNAVQTSAEIDGLQDDALADAVARRLKIYLPKDGLEFLTHLSVEPSRARLTLPGRAQHRRGGRSIRDSPATVERECALAKAWLFRRLSPRQ